MTNLALVDTGGPNEIGPHDYLSILARAKIALDTATEIRVDVADVRRFENQPRKYFNTEGIVRLAQSIGAGGQTMPGIIRENPGATRYELIDGERRWRAVSSLPPEGRPLYKALLVVADDDVVQFLISGVANFNREGHTSIETLETIDRLLGFNFPMEEIAAVLGISTVWAYQMHGLKKLVPEVLDLLNPELPKKKQLPLTAAIQISKMDESLQAPLAQRVINRDVSLANLRTEVVRIASVAGMPVRVREIDPRKKLSSVLTKAGVLVRTSDDIKALVSTPDLKKHLASRPGEVRKLIALLREARDSVFACEEILNRI